MRRVSVICAAAVSCLAFGVFANASAEASVFSFSFGSGVTGTFVTADDAASDPGYQPILTLTFSQLQGELSEAPPSSSAMWPEAVLRRERPSIQQPERS